MWWCRYVGISTRDIAGSQFTFQLVGSDLSSLDELAITALHRDRNSTFTFSAGSRLQTPARQLSFSQLINRLRRQWWLFRGGRGRAQKRDRSDGCSRQWQRVTVAGRWSHIVNFVCRSLLVADWSSVGITLLLWTPQLVLRFCFLQ